MKRTYNGTTLLKIKLLSVFISISAGLIAQDNEEVSQFNQSLNEFISVRDLALNIEGDEAFFTIQSPFQEISQIVSIKKEKDRWSEPELMSFSGAYSDLEPFLSADGKRLYFVSDRPLIPSDTLKKDFDIWYVERSDPKEKWSAPRNIGASVNSEYDEFYPSLSENNNLYFTMTSPAGIGKDDLYFSQWKNGNYTTPVLLNKNINSDGYEFNAFVSKNETFLLFTKYNAKDGHGSGDLYISKKDSLGNWQKAVNLGATINTKYMEYCPYYDEKNQTLYFTSKRNKLKPKAFKNVWDFQQYVKQHSNGLSKIYKTRLQIK